MSFITITPLAEYISTFPLLRFELGKTSMMGSEVWTV